MEIQALRLIQFAAFYPSAMPANITIEIEAINQTTPDRIVEGSSLKSQPGIPLALAISQYPVGS